MNPYLVQIEEAVRAVVVHSPTVFSWFGKRSPRILRSVERELTARTARNYLLYNLQSRLYRDFYSQGAASPTRREYVGSARLSGDAHFIDELSAANTGRGYWESGWEIQSIEDGLVQARRGGLSLLAYPDEYRSRDGEKISPGVGVSLRFSKENPSISPGFYMAMGDADLNDGSSGRLLRLYWNLTPEGAPILMRSATQRLNAESIPFRLKAINAPESYLRCDSAVLYISSHDYERVAAFLGNIYSEVQPHTRNRVPALTRQVALGLGLAEDPGDGDSFGMHRCGLLAEGIIRAYEAGAVDLQERLQCVIATFTEHGISLDTPYLSPGSTDYEVPSTEDRIPSKKRGAKTPHSTLRTPHSPKDFLDTAHALGTQLVNDAVWYEGRCNWIGAEVQAGKEDAGPLRTVYKALGPDLYTGTAGVALFLSELYSKTGDDAVLRTALGAIRQAISRTADIPPEGRLGLYTGWMGIALSVARVGALLGDADLVEKARSLACEAMRSDAGPNHDLLAGSAGAIVGSLVLDDMLGNAYFGEQAARLGVTVMEAAHKRGPRYSWAQFGEKGGRDLTGFSHGAAGIALALLDLWATTGETEYRHAAEAAFEYERFWFDESRANWPDFRETGGRGSGRNGAHSFATYWCHGAPGIALSRLRAYSLLGDPTLKDEALTALGTTRAAIEGDLASDMGNYSLCHGLAGNSVVLLQGHKVLGADHPGAEDLARSVGAAGIERYAKPGRLWPCGTGGGQAPGLMLGLAGIGHFYLRLYDPSTPCVLLMQGKEWRS